MIEWRVAARLDDGDDPHRDVTVVINVEDYT